MNSSDGARLTLLVSNDADLLHVAGSLLPSFVSVKTIQLLIANPRLLQTSAPELRSLISKVSKACPQLTEIGLIVRGPSKLFGSDGDGNIASADSVADMLSSITSLRLPLFIELSVHKLTGSLRRLCQEIRDASHLYQVVLHECDNQEDSRGQGLLPVLEALSQSPTLQILILEAVGLPAGGVTSRTLAKLGSTATLEHLEIKHCPGLGDEELVPLVHTLTTVKYLNLTAGFHMQQNHSNRQWGNRTVVALAACLRKPSCALKTLALTTNDPKVSFTAIIKAVMVNASLKRLHLYNSGHRNLTRSQDLMKELSSGQAMTLPHCG